MTETVADHILGRLRERDVEKVFAYPGDGINGIACAFGRAGNHPKFHPVAPRGDERLRGGRLRQVHREGGRLHGHLRPRRGENDKVLTVAAQGVMEDILRAAGVGCDR